MVVKSILILPMECKVYKVKINNLCLGLDINLQLLLISIIASAITTTFSISITNMPNNTYVKYARSKFTQRKSAETTNGPTTNISSTVLITTDKKTYSQGV